MEKIVTVNQFQSFNIEKNKLIKFFVMIMMVNYHQLKSSCLTHALTFFESVFNSGE